MDPLGGKFDFFSPSGFEIESDFDYRNSKIKFYFVRALKCYLNEKNLTHGRVTATISKFSLQIFETYISVIYDQSDLARLEISEWSTYCTEVAKICCRCDHAFICVKSDRKYTVTIILWQHWNVLILKIVFLGFSYSFLNFVRVDFDFAYESMWIVEFTAKEAWIVDFRPPLTPPRPLYRFINFSTEFDGGNLVIRNIEGLLKGAQVRTFFCQCTIYAQDLHKILSLMRHICARFTDLPNAQDLRKIVFLSPMRNICAAFAQDCTIPQCARFAQDCTFFSNAQYLYKIVLLSPNALGPLTIYAQNIIISAGHKIFYFLIQIDRSNNIQ